MLTEHLHLVGALGRQCHVLEITTTTGAEVRTRRRHATLGSIVPRAHMRLVEALVGSVDGQRDPLTGQGLVDELGLAVLVMRDASPIMRQTFHRQPLAVGITDVARLATGHFLLTTRRFARWAFLSEQCHQRSSPWV